MTKTDDGYGKLYRGHGESHTDQTARIAELEAEVNKLRQYMTSDLIDIAFDISSERNEWYKRIAELEAEVENWKQSAFRTYDTAIARAEKAEAEVERAVADIKMLVAKNDSILNNERRIIERIAKAESTIATLREALKNVAIMAHNAGEHEIEDVALEAMNDYQ